MSLFGVIIVLIVVAYVKAYMYITALTSRFIISFIHTLMTYLFLLLYYFTRLKWNAKFKLKGYHKICWWKAPQFSKLSNFDMIVKQWNWMMHRVLVLLQSCSIDHYLMAHNWQKWKRVFLTCPCHEIYRVETVGLKSSNYTWKNMIFTNMWNLGQFREELIFCQ